MMLVSGPVAGPTALPTETLARPIFPVDGGADFRVVKIDLGHVGLGAGSLQRRQRREAVGAGIIKG